MSAIKISEKYEHIAKEIVGFINTTGLNVYVSELATVIVPTRKSKNKRLQKKFIKKYGMVNKPGMSKTDLGLFVHPIIFARLSMLEIKDEK